MHYKIINKAWKMGATTSGKNIYEKDKLIKRHIKIVFESPNEWLDSRKRGDIVDEFLSLSASKEIKSIECDSILLEIEGISVEIVFA
jgi:hypothetical protein